MESVLSVASSALRKRSAISVSKVGSLTTSIRLEEINGWFLGDSWTGIELTADFVLRLLGQDVNLSFLGGSTTSLDINVVLVDHWRRTDEDDLISESSSGHGYLMVHNFREEIGGVLAVDFGIPDLSTFRPTIGTYFSEEDENIFFLGGGKLANTGVGHGGKAEEKGYHSHLHFLNSFHFTDNREQTRNLKFSSSSYQLISKQIDYFTTRRGRLQG